MGTNKDTVYAEWKKQQLIHPLWTAFVEYSTDGNDPNTYSPCLDHYDTRHEWRTFLAGADAMTKLKQKDNK